LFPANHAFFYSKLVPKQATEVSLANYSVIVRFEWPATVVAFLAFTFSVFVLLAYKGIQPGMAV
jgi:hypothetical protein